MKLHDITVYGIVDNLTGNIWSGNQWGSPTSLPNLFQTKANAERQLTTGKCGRLKKYATEWSEIHNTNYAYEPRIVEFRLVEK